MATSFTFSATVLGAPDARELGRFYQQLLGWDVVWDAPGWFMLRPDDGRPGLSIQSEPEHVPPAGPPEPGGQQMQLHLDFLVEDLDAAVTHALACGATLAAHQPQDDVRVLFDPAGHPFCVFVE